ncbi:MAG: ATPase, T2SS/T4P/T4SS family, partial [Acidithiobacillus sp.]
MADMDKAQQERHDRLIEQMRRILGSEICAVFNDPAAVEIMLNDDGRVLVERHGAGITELTTLPTSKTLNFLGLMADFRGTTVSREKPIVEGAMPDEFLRARFAGAIPPLMPQPTFAIRLPARSVYTLENYRDSEILTVEQYDRIIQAVTARKNILVSGGTGCFAKGHPILMLDGSIKAVEDVVVGDKVMGPDGKERVVKDAHGGSEEMVRVIPAEGPHFDVNVGHSLALILPPYHYLDVFRYTADRWLSASDAFKAAARLVRVTSGTAPRPIPIQDAYSLGDGAYYGFEVDHPDHLFVDGHFMVQGNSGKTTLLNAVSDTIAKMSGLDQRIVILEDVREIVCNAPNTVSMLTDPDTGIDLTRLLKLTLRYRPDRIFVGEVRDGAALALLKAWGTGHPGGLATLHANNPLSALTRLDQLCQEANVPSQMPLIREAVDVVIQITRDPAVKAGRRISDILFIEKED